VRSSLGRARGEQPERSHLIIRTAFVSTYPPRRCGIATFTHDLAAAAGGGEIAVLHPVEQPPFYPVQVEHRIRKDVASDYVRTARSLSDCVDVVSIQHEYGIWGGEDGELVLDFARTLRVPAVPTLHTVLREPSPHQRRVLKDLIDIAEATAMIHRPSPLRGGAHIWLSYSPDLRHWGDHKLVLEARDGAWWDAGKIGLGPPPLETPEGWLVMYHGVHLTADGPIYRVGLALLDLGDPSNVLHRLDEWVFGPEAPYEITGDVGRVVFPCGWVHDEPTDRLFLYYGAADTSIGLATATFSEVLARVRNAPRSAAI
jgi:hypothetical protein